ncbi:hypothetical protein LTR37_003642 [Vermiconidia calcicola]|uniref:Uncharacterized protein n=1 Tax=Vermiconidia calcicola TaxID=1690605 RepID=A0ACC3NPJ3_9PEZI|nr:hypothetical protein LTR37_003642 [Vermiconidia calcicola]
MAAVQEESRVATLEENDDVSIYAIPSVPAVEVSFISTGTEKHSRRGKIIDEDEPLIDTTAALTLRSKKTDRAQKRLQKRQQRAAARPASLSLLDLPPELVQEIVTYLRPSNVFVLAQVSGSIHGFIEQHESAIARDIIKRRYWVLARCFPLPVAFDNVDSTAYPSLLSEKRQDMLQIHRKPYQHVKGIDPLKKNLNEREPIPMIPRGTSPEWNRQLLETNASVVEKAMASPLCYAGILERHLRTTVQTITRTFRGKKTVHPKRLYHLTPAEADKETDAFLERSGPPSYEFPWHRDNYYGLEAYVPNRKWSKEKEKWMYYAEGLHERDLQWIKERFTGVDAIGDTSNVSLTSPWLKFQLGRMNVQRALENKSSSQS